MFYGDCKTISNQLQKVYCMFPRLYLSLLTNTNKTCFFMTLFYFFQFRYSVFAMPPGRINRIQNSDSELHSAKPLVSSKASFVKAIYYSSSTTRPTSCNFIFFKQNYYQPHNTVILFHPTFIFFVSFCDEEGSPGKKNPIRSLMLEKNLNLMFYFFVVHSFNMFTETVKRNIQLGLKQTKKQRRNGFFIEFGWIDVELVGVIILN